MNHFMKQPLFSNLKYCVLISGSNDVMLLSVVTVMNSPWSGSTGYYGASPPFSNNR